MFTIDELKKNCQMIHFFGLGFIQLKLDKNLRLHFYTTKYAPIIADDSAHNHRYDFSSKILKGSLTNEIYTYSTKPTHLSYILEQESCNKDNKVSSEPREVALLRLSTETYKKGDLYYIPHETFHKVSVNEDTITLLMRSNYKKELADVIRNPNDEKICPFSKQVPEKELWEIVEDMWKDI